MNLNKWLDAKGLKQRELSRKLGYSSNGPLSAVVRGDTPVPMEKVPDWADALGLEGKERQLFMDECGAECFPAWCWDRLIKAESDLAKVRLELADARTELTDLAAQIPNARFKTIKPKKKRG